MWAILALLSAVTQSYVNVMQKRIVTGMNSSVFSFLFNFFCLIFLIPILPLVQWSVFAILIIFAKSFLTTLGFYLRTKALKWSDISEVIPLIASFNPLFVLIMAIFLIGERISLLNFLGILIILFGSLEIVSNFKLKSIKGQLNISHVLVLISTILYAANSVITKFLLNTGIDIFTILFFTTLFSTFELFMLVRGKSRKVAPVLETKLGQFVLAGLLTAIYRFLAVAAMGLGPVSLVNATRRLQSPISVFLGGRILKEGNWKLKLLASIAMLAGVYLMTL